MDFQEFLSDLDKAVGDVTASDAAFAAFAAAVSQPATPSAADVAALRQRVDAWHRRVHAFVAGTLPPVGWGPGRLDAIGIIFNRISGTDVGPPPDFLIPENMKIGDAPVRYPFLWNSPMQNQTDWAGFVLNGNRVFALARNAGQALAFGNFEPRRSFGPFFNYANSINFDGLKRLEELLQKMGPPKWPSDWPIDSKLAKDGQKIFERQCSKGCHEKKEVRALRDLFVTTWVTPVQNVGTDTRQFDELGWRVKTGALKGAGIPLIARHLEEEDYAVHMMFSAVAGAILDNKLYLGSDVGSGDGFGSSLPPNAQKAPSTSLSLSPAPVKASIAPPSSAQPPNQPESLTIEPGTLLEASMKLACWREFGPRRLTCTTARCRHWRNCSYRLRSACHNSKLARDTTSKMLVLTSHKRGQIVRSPIAMTSIQETADAGMTMARACATTKRRHSSNI
jgi:hypothetical protein